MTGTQRQKNVQPFAFEQLLACSEERGPTAPHDPQALEKEVARLSLALETEVLKARAEAYEEALAHLREERDTALLSAADALQASLEAVGERWAEAEARLASEAVEMAFAAADHLAGRAIAREPEAIVGDALARALEQARRGRPIEVRVHPALVGPVQAMVAERQVSDRRRLSIFVHADPSLPIGDARLGWDDSRLTLDAAARRNGLLSELEQLLPSQ